MPSFRKAKNQAARAVTQRIAVGSARHSNRNDGKVHSFGTARAYQQALTGFTNWLKQKFNNQSLERTTTEQARQYLEERAKTVRQKTLDLDRQALQILPGVGKLERFKSRLDRSPLETNGRAYTLEQVKMVAAAQSEHHALATEIAHAAGLRGHELLTLRLADKREASTHREWLPERFEGRPDSVRYTVAGKGGLAWSRSFSAASKRALGWSTGGHGLRHSYAQERIEDLQRNGHTYDSALELVCQEMGHFRPDITEVYLR